MKKKKLSDQIHKICFLISQQQQQQQKKGLQEFNSEFSTFKHFVVPVPYS
jgi:hypothetical protein